LEAEGLAVLDGTAADSAARAWRRLAVRQEEELESVRSYFEAATQYLAVGKFARGERRIWARHATDGLGIRGLAAALNIKSEGRIRRILVKHRAAAGLVSPLIRKDLLLRALGRPLVGRKKLDGRGNFANTRGATSSSRPTAASRAAFLRAL
jgi:hypothetical protein